MSKFNQSMLNAQKSKGGQALKQYAPFAVGALLMLSCSGAFAAGDELGDGICKLVNLLQGKFLFGVSVLAMLGGGAALLFGAELTDGIKKAVTIVAIVGLVVSFASILSMAFSSMTSC